MRASDVLRSVAAAACIAAIVGLGGCSDDEARAKAAKKAAKAQREGRLLAMEYPRSTGVQPRSMEISYDGAADRTFMTLRLTGMRVGGGGASSVSSATLHLTSNHKGRTRPTDNPEGSVDGGLIVQTSSPGVLAYSGPPGRVTIGGETLPLKDASGKDEYSSTKKGSGAEEIVRFRFPTEHLISAATSGGFTMSFGTVQLEISGQNLADLREFAARMNPRP